jgi:hypothetical protein
MILFVILKETYTIWTLHPILHNIAKFLYLQLQLLMNNPNLARQWSVITQNMKLTRNHYPVSYKREKNSLLTDHIFTDLAQTIKKEMESVSKGIYIHQQINYHKYDSSELGEELCPEYEINTQPLPSKL